MVDDRQIELCTKVSLLFALTFAILNFQLNLFFFFNFIQIRTPIDIKAVLKNSIVNQKLIVPLPLVIQFILMLDSISLRSEYYRDVFHILMMTTNYESNLKLSLRPTSVFMVGFLMSKMCQMNIIRIVKLTNQ